MSQTFIKTQEDFTCLHCGASVIGNGYTNHCPACLYSRHVDEYPGDRAAGCGGLMRPVSWRGAVGEQDILHRCELCGHEKWNKIAKDDNMEALSQIS